MGKAVPESTANMHRLLARPWPRFEGWGKGTVKNPGRERLKNGHYCGSFELADQPPLALPNSISFLPLRIDRFLKQMDFR
jgi:hypothetical protein